MCATKLSNCNEYKPVMHINICFFTLYYKTACVAQLIERPFCDLQVRVQFPAPADKVTFAMSESSFDEPEDRSRDQ